MRELSIHEVHVHLADPGDLQADERCRARATALLSPDELERLEHYRFERDRAIYLATRWLARTVLSEYESTAPASWRFVTGKYGRPEIAEDSPLRFNAARPSPSPLGPSCTPSSGAGLRALRFNLSNTHGLVACAVTRCMDVGIDVERTVASPPLEAAARFFAPSEVEALQRLPVTERPRRFFDYWTLKESYIKARGLGLALPLDRFSFVLENGRSPRIEIDPSLGDEGERWQFEQHVPTNDHLLAVCVRKHDARVSTITYEWRRPFLA